MDDLPGITTLEDLSENKGITTVMWNCRSIFNKLSEIIHIIDTSNADIAIFVESWLTSSVNDNMISLDGYNMLRHDRNSNSNKVRGGGIVVYYNDGLNISSRNDLWICTPDLELLVMRLHLINVREIYFLVVYRPPAGNIKTS